MPATYNPALVTDRDWVRFLAGDREPTRALLDDAEIDGLLSEEPNKYFAAAAACELILSRSGGLVMKQVGDLRLQWGGTAQSSYQNYITSLRQRGAQALSGDSYFLRNVGSCPRR